MRLEAFLLVFAGQNNLMIDVKDSTGSLIKFMAPGWANLDTDFLGSPIVSATIKSATELEIVVQDANGEQDAENAEEE